MIPDGKTTCGLCSRLRRGILYTFAAGHGMTRIALGHHRDDILETLFLNLFHGGKLKAMPPKLLSDDGRHVVIRPLAYCRERDLAAYAEARQFPIIPCNLCGSQPNLQRQAIKAMLRQWEKQFPGRVENIFAALQNVAPSHLADAGLFDFAGLGSRTGGRAPDWLPGGCEEAEEKRGRGHRAGCSRAAGGDQSAHAASPAGLTLFEVRCYRCPFPNFFQEDVTA